MKFNRLSIFVALAATLSMAHAQTIWNNGGDTFSWSDGANWSTGAQPVSGADIQIGTTQPSYNTVIVDTSGAVTVGNFTFSGGLSSTVDVTASSVETLKVNGAITNSSSFTDIFSLPVTAGASAVWSGLLIFSNNVNIGTTQITLANPITFSGTNINFDITTMATYGRFIGAGTATVSGETINIGSTYTGVIGDTFDLTSGNFSGATLGSLPVLTTGKWDSSTFLTNGQLSVVPVPEPTTWALLAGSLTTVMVFRRRRP